MKKVLVAVAMLALALLPAVTLAANVNLGLNQFGNQIGLGTKSLPATIAGIINVAMGLLGMVVVILILAGGFIWMTSGGDEAKTKQAKGLIFGGVIGLAIILAAYAIAQFVVGSLVNAT